MVTRIPEQDFSKHFNTQKGIILDVRTDSEYAAGHLQGAIKLDFLGGEFNEKMKDLDPNETYYLYCKSGNRSGKAATLLFEAGFQQVYNVGGFDSLSQTDFPIEY